MPGRDGLYGFSEATQLLYNIRGLVCVSLGLLLLWVGGCGYFWALSEPSEPEQIPVTSLAENFRGSQTGRIEGRVVWQGERPIVADFAVETNPIFHPKWPHETREKLFRNPLKPQVSELDSGIANAVVFLREVDPKRSKPWNHPPVSVHFQASQLKIHQGRRTGVVGVVRRGEKVHFVNDEERYHGLRVRGANFFTLTLPTPNRVRTRQMVHNGLVELSSAAEYYWLRSYLFVSEHPYYVVTEPSGKFELEEIPSGQYELVAWVPNWNKKDHDRNPESMCISRMRYKGPVEKTIAVEVEVGGSQDVTFEFTPKEFE
ncbi:MAG: hypothetical protein ACFCD0_02425 [Gemmataceae bacterium]